jgi:hypothetical protein
MLSTSAVGTKSKIQNKKKVNPLDIRTFQMKALWSGIGTVDGRGKLNGSVASQNRYGNFWRVKVTPVNRRTSFQTAVRATFSFLSTAWGSLLTEVQRQAFTAFASNHPFSDVFGKVKTLDGKAMYIALNAALQNAGLAQITSPPTDTTTGDVGALTLTATVAAGGTLSLATNEANIPGGAQINIYATKLMPNGRNFVKSQLAFIGSLDAGASPYDIKADWIAKYGAFPTIAGGKIFVVAQIITTGGWLSVPAGTSAFVS